MANRFIGRSRPLKEDDLKSLSLPGDVKERLQIKPEKPAKKRPFAENWTRFKSRPVGGGSIASDDAVGPARHALSGQPPDGYDASYDDVNGEEHAMATKRLAMDGSVIERDALKEKQTNEHSEHLYEEVVDKQTGKKSLLFRSNFFDRILSVTSD